MQLSRVPSTGYAGLNGRRGGRRSSRNPLNTAARKIPSSVKSSEEAKQRASREGAGRRGVAELSKGQSDEGQPRPSKRQCAE